MKSKALRRVAIIVTFTAGALCVAPLAASASTPAPPQNSPAGIVGWLVGTIHPDGDPGCC